MTMLDTCTFQQECNSNSIANQTKLAVITQESNWIIESQHTMKYLGETGGNSNTPQL